MANTELIGRILYDGVEWELANAPYIGSTQTWWVHNGTEYVDTNIKATVKGERGYQGRSVTGVFLADDGRLGVQLFDPATGVSSTIYTSNKAVSSIDDIKTEDGYLVIDGTNAPNVSFTTKLDAQTVFPTNINVDSATGHLQFTYGQNALGQPVVFTVPVTVFATITGISVTDGVLSITFNQPGGGSTTFEAPEFGEDVRGYSISKVLFTEGDSGVVNYSVYIDKNGETLLNSGSISMEAGKVDSVNNITPDEGSKNITLTATDIELTDGKTIEAKFTETDQALSEAGKVETINNVSPDAGTKNVTLTGDNINLSSSDTTKISTKISSLQTSVDNLSTNLTSYQVFTLSATTPTNDATPEQKKKLWINTSTGVPYVWNGTAWLALGAVWK